MKKLKRTSIYSKTFINCATKLSKVFHTCTPQYPIKNRISRYEKNLKVKIRKQKYFFVWNIPLVKLFSFLIEWTLHPKHGTEKNNNRFMFTRTRFFCLHSLALPAKKVINFFLALMAEEHYQLKRKCHFSGVYFQSRFCREIRQNRFHGMQSVSCSLLSDKFKDLKAEKTRQKNRLDPLRAEKMSIPWNKTKSIFTPVQQQTEFTSR